MGAYRVAPRLYHQHTIHLSGLYDSCIPPNQPYERSSELEVDEHMAVFSLAQPRETPA